MIEMPSSPPSNPRASFETGGWLESIGKWPREEIDWSLKFPAFHGNGQLRFIMMMVFDDVAFIDWPLARGFLVWLNSIVSRAFLNFAGGFGYLTAIKVPFRRSIKTCPHRTTFLVGLRTPIQERRKCTAIPTPVIGKQWRNSCLNFTPEWKEETPVWMTPIVMPRCCCCGGLPCTFFFLSESWAATVWPRLDNPDPLRWLPPVAPVRANQPVSREFLAFLGLCV